jgi:protoheme IX farnesyltransferase
LALGLFLALFAVALLGYAVNLLAAAILAFAIFFYAVIYTMLLKRATPQNIVIGGAAGAFPPLIGQVAVSAHISLYGIVLFLIVFLWTPPHFWALALYRNGDYAAAGVPMLPVTAGLAATRRQIVFYSYLLVPVTLAPVFLHEAGLVYALAALYCGYRFLRHVRSLFMQADDASARKLFGYSILYLFVLFGFLMIDKAGDMLMKPLILNGLAL